MLWQGVFKGLLGLIVKEAQAANLTANVSCSIFSLRYLSLLRIIKMLHQTTQAATSSLAPGVMEDLSIGVEGMGDISGDPAAKI